MSSSTAFAGGPGNRSMPASTVIPVLHYPDVAAASAWLCRTLGFRERLRIGSHRIQLQVGEGAVVIAQGPPAPPDARFAGHSVMVRVSDVDEHYRHAKSAGAKVVGDLVSFPYGERQYSVVDPGGHLWTFSQTEADVDPASWGGELMRGEAG